MAQSIRDNLSFVGLDWANNSSDDRRPSKEVKMLDYACGSGFLSRVFAPYVSTIKAIDASPRDDRTVHGQQHRIPAESPRAQPASIMESSAAEYNDFDLITVGAALHHFPDAEDAVERLAARLKAGGVLYIHDLFAASEEEEKEEQGVGDESTKTATTKRPTGFKEGEVQMMLEKAGLVGFRFQIVPGNFEIEMPNRKVLGIRWFMARAMKPDVEER
ncbi:hypothetical protein N0V83_001708 [Neocucurbitaria cava]|uniref:S-adenosyl-L-methionine-dependent methyltransferase n=1 Tax=Neocucurbitaria cava TaxID=798079 RepID=A0A9W8YHN9_9PLEO|nr:hypothetical protein N0V83_001708 [Neocucurbitaria cava]